MLGVALQQRLPERVVSMLFALLLPARRGADRRELAEASRRPLRARSAAPSAACSASAEASSSFRRWRSSWAAQLEATATSLLAIVPVAMVGTWRQYRHGNVRIRDGVVLGLLSIPGVAIGVVIANAVPQRALELGFAALLLFVASSSCAGRWAAGRGPSAAGDRPCLMPIEIGPGVAIPLRRSSCGPAAPPGPGGQHANVTASRIEACSTSPRPRR